jgi:hypothetical protein
MMDEIQKTDEEKTVYVDLEKANKIIEKHKGKKDDTNSQKRNRPLPSVRNRSVD